MSIVDVLDNDDFVAPSCTPSSAFLKPLQTVRKTFSFKPVELKSTASNFDPTSVSQMIKELEEPDSECIESLVNIKKTDAIEYTDIENTTVSVCSNTCKDSAVNASEFEHISRDSRLNTSKANNVIDSDKYSRKITQNPDISFDMNDFFDEFNDTLCKNKSSISSNKSNSELKFSKSDDSKIPSQETDVNTSFNISKSDSIKNISLSKNNTALASNSSTEAYEDKFHPKPEDYFDDCPFEVCIL